MWQLRPHLVYECTQTCLTVCGSVCLCKCDINGAWIVRTEADFLTVQEDHKHQQGHHLSVKTANS